MNVNVCPICGTELKLSRIDLNDLKQLIARNRKYRYFVPEEEVNDIVHNFHVKKENLIND